MSKLYLFIMLFSFLGLNLSAQIQEPVRFTVEQKKTGTGELEIRFKADIDEGWHVYGPENAEGGPTVATLTLENSKGVELKGGLKVDGKVHRAMDEMFEMEVTYVEGEASFVQTLSITEPAYEVSGYLTYGACSDQNCMPPTDVEFSFKGQSEAVADPAAKTTENEMRPEENKIPSGGKISEGHENWWKPVVEELQSFGQDEQAADNTLWGIFLLGFLGGFVALFTPCVWPIIPMTVSFFLKRSQDKRKGVRDASLEYSVIGEGDGISLLDILLHTGRTHQIRVHMSHLGHALLGDEVYAANKTQFEKAHPSLFCGQALHAKRLSLTHPKTKERMTFECDLPKEFDKALEILRNESNL